MKKAIAMKCTQENWDSIKDRIPKEKIQNVFDFEKYPYLANNFDQKGIISTTTKHNVFPYEYHETFNAKIFLQACGIEFEKKFEITKEQILEIEDCGNYMVTERLKSMFPEAFKKELEVNKWYKNKYNCLFRITEKDDEKYKAYGFMQGKWKDYGEFSSNHDLSTDTEATSQEVETALINEAKKRGLWNNEYIKCICLGKKNNSKNLQPCFEDNQLWSNYGLVFDNGKWAKIIETITIQEAEKLLNKKIV